ncbi:MAG: serine/threonine protein kinase [Phormidesmis sp.]
MDDELIGQTIGNQYTIQSLLGKQKGRRTFLAQDTQHEQQVVIKLILFGPDFTWEDIKLFERETETLKSLNHSAIPRYLDSFEVETTQWKGFALVQSYIAAKSLQSLVASGQTFQEAQLRQLACQLLTILSYLHNRYPAVVHRDIKPSNILLSNLDDDQLFKVYLVDFGSVHTVSHTGTMTVVGTYGYMPPEQFGGRAVPASDLYSLGATLIYLITGQHPADLDNLHQALHSYRISPTFKHCIQQLTRTALAERTTSAEEALRQLTEPASVESTEHQSSELQTATDSAVIEADHPQPLSLDYSALETSSNFFEFEIQFFEDRLIGEPFLNDKGAINAFLLAVTVVFVFGGLFFSSGTLLLWAAALIIASVADRLQSRRQGTGKDHFSLRLRLPSGGPLLIRLDKLKNANVAGRPDTDLANIDRQTQLSHLELKAIEAISPAIGRYSQLSFFFAKESKQTTGSLSIRGSRAEIDWLCTQLIRWKNLPVKKREASRTIAR